MDDKINSTLTPQKKSKLTLNLPSPVNARNIHHNNNNNKNTQPQLNHNELNDLFQNKRVPVPKSSSSPLSSSPLPPPLKPQLSPTKMNMHDMDIRIRQQRMNSLDALVKEQIVDHSSSSDDDDHDDDTNNINDEFNEIDFENQITTTAKQIKTKNHQNTDNTESVENDKIIALINGGSGARKGWALAKELIKYNTSIYDLLDLNLNISTQQKLGLELKQYENKCIVLICGGDGSQAWAASLIDKALSTLTPTDKLPFPPTCVFPMGTGNDLSRSLGWGSIEPNRKQLIEYIADIHFCAKITKRWSDLDRWRITYTFHQHTNNIDDIESNGNNNNINDQQQSVHNGFDKRSSENGQHPSYYIEPPKQYQIQQNPKSKTYQQLHAFDPPLPSTFICYLSIGYDALVAYKFEKERRAHPERFNNQFKNQIMYVKHGFSEFFKPSDPINEAVDVIINNNNVSLPDNTRSLKLININSAMNGLFFWGSGKSRDGELQNVVPPRLNDSKIEVMATRGVHDMMQYRVNISHAQRISQTNDIMIRIKKPGKHGLALQIDGEAWMIDKACTLRIQLHDKLPVVIGYNNPRGVESWLQASLDDNKILAAKQSFRQRLRSKYEEKNKPFININNSGYSSEEKEGNEQNNNMNTSIMTMFGFGIDAKKSPKTPKRINVEQEEERKYDNDQQQYIPNMAFFDEDAAVSSPNDTGSGKKRNIMNKIEDLLSVKRKSKSNLNEIKSEEIEIDAISSDSNRMEVDVPEYLSKNPSNKSNDILQSSVFNNKKDGIFLDRFTWWKVTRASNHNKSIDAETATDAISPTHHHHGGDRRKIQSSFRLSPKKSRRASSFF